MFRSHGWTSGVVYIINNNLTYRPVYIVLVHSVYMGYRKKRLMLSDFHFCLHNQCNSISLETWINYNLF